MKKIKRFTNRMLSMMLAGTLAVGSLSMSALGAEETGSVEATATEISLENETEGSMAESSASAFSDTSENAVENDIVTSYKVTLDANGGYFNNEWDDVLNESLEKTDILNKFIPVGGTVSTVPVNKSGKEVSTFLGWSLERDGELLSQKQEGYAPVGDCVLYAVWNYD